MGNIFYIDKLMSKNIKNFGKLKRLFIWIKFDRSCTGF